jgi:hypothetical protein
MANISEDRLLAVVNAKELDAKTYQSELEVLNEFLESRNNADYYGTEVPGRSRFVSNDVKDTNESAHTSLVRMFLGAGSIIKFTPSNPDDEKQTQEAEEKTNLVDWIVRGQTNSYKTQSSFLTDMLKLKTGILKYFHEETEKVEEHEWQGLTADEVLEQLTELKLDLVDDSIDDETGEITHGIEPKDKNATGKIEHTENDDGTFDIKVKLKVKRQEIKIINVPTDTFLISPDATDLDEAELVGDESYKSRGDLLAEGYSKDLVESIPQGSNGRTYHRDADGRIATGDFNEWASEQVPIADLYVLVDYDDDGIAERRRIQKSGDIILFNEPFDHVSYATASSLIIPNSVIGEGWGEQVVDIQEVNTAITRGTLDNIYAVNNTKKAVRIGKDGVNLDEALSSKIGGVVQVKGERPLTDMIMPLTTEFIGDKALLIKQHMDQMKANRVGEQLTSQGLDGDALAKETATRFTGIEKTGQAKVEKIARNAAEVGYRKLYEGIAWMLAHHQMDEIEFSVLGRPLKANPANWKNDNNVSTEIGLGAGDNQQIIQNMQGAWVIYSQLTERQSKLVDEKKGYNILAKLYRAMDIKDVSMFVNDPEEPAEQLRADNEELNKMVLQSQEQVEQMSEQIRQLQALSEVEVIKAVGKAESDNKKAALDIAKLEENKRQFNIDIAQDDEHHDEDIALELTKIDAQSKEKG